MEKPRILIFTTAYYPFAGGAEVAIQEITRRLKERFDFYIVTSRFRRELSRRESRPEGMIIRIGFGNRFDKYLLPFFLFYQESRASIVLGVDIGHGSLSAALYKLFHPSTAFILNIQYGEGDSRVAFGRFGVINAAFRFMLARADLVTAISSYLLNLARNYGYHGPSEIIHNGADIERFANREGEKINRTRKVVITTSRLVPKNGVDILIKAIAEAKKQVPDIQLRIVGDGPERKKLESLVKEEKIQDNVKFLGNISHAEIPKYLHEADVFVRPSRSEGMGVSFVEALAAGLPIIATPVGGILDIIQDEKTGLFCESENPTDCAEKILRLLRDKELSANIAVQGKKMVEEKFSWDKISAEYERIFEKLGENLAILIATPLLPPQLGGPAQYAKNLAEEFFRLGHKVKVVSFGKYLRFPSGIRHLVYLFALIRHALHCDLIFALDYTSVGLPAAVVSLIFRRPLVIRVEGDFLWESFVERTRRDITLREFYQNPPQLNSKERLIKWLSGWVMRQAEKLVFSSEWRRKMVIDAYKIPMRKTEIIQNVFPSTKVLETSAYRREPKVILWAGRMLYLKNLRRLISAFAKINVSSYKLHLIGEGPERKNLEKLIKEYRAEDRIRLFPPMDHKEVMNRVDLAKLVILPSLSDVGPNIVAEALALLVPVIMTKESGYAEIFKNWVDLIDPLDEKDIRQKLENFIKHPAEREVMGMVRPWSGAAGEWLKLFNSL